MEFRVPLFVLVVNQAFGLGVKQDENDLSRRVALDDSILSLFKRSPLEESPRIANLMYQRGLLPHDDILTRESNSPKLTFRSESSDIDDAETSMWLSKMSNEQLLDLLRQKPDKKEYNIDDLMGIMLSGKGTENEKIGNPVEIKEYPKLNKDVIVVDQLIPVSNSYKSLIPDSNEMLKMIPINKNGLMSTHSVNNNREINYFDGKLPMYGENYKPFEDTSSKYKLLSGQRVPEIENNALETLLGNIAGNQYQESNVPKPDLKTLNLWENMLKLPSSIVANEKSYSEQNMDALDYNIQKEKEILFDALVSTLKMLCCSSNRRSDAPYIKKTPMVGVMPPFLQWAFKHTKDKELPRTRRMNDETKPAKSQEQLFLVLNEEIPSNGTGGLVMVDPDSLSSNSTVLPLGPITDDINNDDLKIVMNKVTNELRKDEYKELLSQLANGINNGAVPGKLMLDSEVTRRYFRPHRCHHRSQLTRVSGPKWLVCTGYVGFNTPSIYDG